MDESHRRYYLDAMGVTVWERRDLPRFVEPVTEALVPSKGVASRDGGTLPEEEAAERHQEPKPRTTRKAKIDGKDGGGLQGCSPANDMSVPAQTSAPPGVEEGNHPPQMEEPPPYDEIPPDWQPATLPGEDLPPVSGLDWDGLRERVRKCRACGLRQGCKQTVFGVGNTQADLLVIGEAPGADEDRQGEPFVGRAGLLLNEMLLAMGFKREQVFIANILKCRPPNNRDPKPEEALHCEPFLLRQIELLQPRAILSVGRISAQNLLKTDIPVGKLRGRVHAYGEQRIPLVVTYHPAYLLRSPEQKGKSWDDLQLALSQLRGKEP